MLLAEALAGLRRPPRVLVSASAMGVYGNRGDEVLTEDGSVQATIFSDGTRVTVNYSEKQQETPGSGMMAPVSWKAS